MEVVYSAEELVEESTEGWGWDWCSDGLGVVVDYLLDVSVPCRRRGLGDGEGSEWVSWR